MPKQALGRGLGNLLKAAKAKPPSEGLPPNQPSQPPALSPGMAVLLRSGQTTATSPTQPALSTHPVPGIAVGDANPGVPAAPAPAAPDRPTPARSKRLLRASLIAADVLMVGLAARLVFNSGGHFRFAEAALCVIALLIGAWLTCLAIWLD